MIGLHILSLELRPEYAWQEWNDRSPRSANAVPPSYLPAAVGCILMYSAQVNNRAGAGVGHDGIHRIHAACTAKEKNVQSSSNSDDGLKYHHYPSSSSPFPYP